MEFTGKKAIVTGATRGIGKAVTLALLSRGAQVIGIYAGNTKAAEQLTAEAEQLSGILQLHQLDVREYTAVEEFFSQIESTHDSIDILVNNAGVRRDAMVALMKLEDWQQVIDVNLGGGFNMSKFAVPLMMKQKYGRIIFITSPMGSLGFPGQGNYAASKAGQVGLAKSLSKEVAKKKITVNCVSPGFIATDLIDDLTDVQVKEYKKMVPLKRFGKPEEVAEAVLFLASEKAAYINGAVLEVTGGL
ncbi:3-oxoacyl-ACP reductase FabG [Desulfogranum japonicum]|uniref:3-oxoacyl-ACP reductase FabG n=1 Tax=Desulfogranum japonicum TaxID=231447 RepID=UPI00048EB807|nr:3-oxoacyl-ACP reductase FabG [Desulfogranum japonicum]